MATISSTTFKTRAGSGTIDIANANLTNSGGDTFEVADIGSIKAEYDLEDDSEEAQSVFFNLGTFTFSVFDKLSGGDSLFNRIDTDLASTDDIDVTLNFTISETSRSITEVFVARFKNIKYQYLARTLTFECEYVFESTDTALDIFTDNPSDVEDYWDGSTSHDCMSAFDYITNALDLINTNNTNVVRSSAFPDDQRDVGEEAWLVVDEVGVTDITTASELLYKLGALDGAVIGSIMGYNYFVYRLDTTATTLTTDDVEEVTPTFGYKSYFTIKTISLGNADNIGSTAWTSTHSLLGNSDGLNDNANKVLSVYFDMDLRGPALVAGTFVAANSRYEREGNSLVRTLLDAVVDGGVREGVITIITDDGAGSNSSVELADGDLIFFGNEEPLTYEVSSQTGSSITLKEPTREEIEDNTAIYEWNALGSRDSMAENAADAYASAYNANGTRRIEIVVFGIDSVKPYEAFTLDSSFDSPLNGKTFRPSSMEYRLTEDKIKIEAYEL